LGIEAATLRSVGETMRRMWIFGASGMAIMTLIVACGEGQWAKEPLPTCDDGDEECSGKASGSKPPKSKGSSTTNGGPTETPIETTEEEQNQGGPTPTPPASQPDASTPKDSGGPTTTPKGPNCLSNANTCIAITLKCGCAEDCCAGTVCAQVGGLVQNTCCKIGGASCTSHSECCGQLLCKPNATGTGSSCQ